MQAHNERPVNIEIATQTGYQTAPLHDFFMTRYVAAYANEMDAFISMITGEKPDIPTGQDGLNALVIADCAVQSADSGEMVKIPL